jgi:hypothetical protein
MAKEPALRATALAQPTFAARRALVQRVGDQLASALKVAAELIDLDAH